METDYKVKLEVFEGPLDLLLYLIKRDEIDIYDISIERITRQYLEYLQAFKELKIDIAGELRNETEKAWCLFDGTRYVWLPKSQCEWDADAQTMAMPTWLAKDKGLI